MTNDFMEYKGYRGSIEYSDEDKCWHGKIEGIRSLISYYEAEDKPHLVDAFQDAVDDYLDLCEQEGIEPEKGDFSNDS